MGYDPNRRKTARKRYSRHRGSRKPARPSLPKGTYRGTVADGSDLGQAAQIVADEASRLAAGNGMAETAASVSVEGSGDSYIIYSDAPAAYPNEVAGVRHPVFGPTLKNPAPAWVDNKHRPFMEPAAENKATAAMERYARKLDKLLEKAGFK